MGGGGGGRSTLVKCETLAKSRLLRRSLFTQSLRYPDLDYLWVFHLCVLTAVFVAAQGNTGCMQWYLSAPAQRQGRLQLELQLPFSQLGISV